MYETYSIPQVGKKLPVVIGGMQYAEDFSKTTFHFTFCKTLNIDELT